MKVSGRLLLLSAALCTALPATVSVAHASSVLTYAWHDVVNGPSEPFGTFQGPAAGDLAGNGQEDVVAAYPDGLVRAYAATNGALVWQQQTDGGISSTPTLSDIYGDGRLETIVTTRSGSVYVFDPAGNIEPGWPQHTINGAPATSFQNAFFGGVAVGDLFGDGQKELTAAAYDHFLYVWHTDGSAVAGFPIDLSDTAWDTPLLVPNANNPSQLDIVVGGDSSGPAYGEPYAAGGVWYRFTNAGCPYPSYVRTHGGHSCAPAGSNWPTVVDQVTWSSPAAFNAGGWNVVTGTGFYFGAPGSGTNCIANCGRQMTVYDNNGGIPAGDQPVTATGQIQASPAIGDIGNGDPNDIVLTTNGSNNNGGSCLYAFSHAANPVNSWVFNPQCGKTSQWSNPTIGPINGATRGIWLGNGPYLTAIDDTGTEVWSSQFKGTSPMSAPGDTVFGAPALFNIGSGVEVAALGATGGTNFNQWELQVLAVPGAPATLGAHSWPTFHGNGNADGRAQAVTPSSVPSSVAAVGGDASAQVSWTAPIDTGSNAVASYQVSIYDKTSTLATGLTNPQSFSTTSGTVTGLTNGQPYFFRVSANNGAASSLSVPSFSVTPVSATAPAMAPNNTNFGVLQYRLPNSDGVTWQDLDPNNLAMTVPAGAGGNYLVTANADLWTSQAGYNQDIGICVVAAPSTCSAAGAVVVWKESGGFGGTYSPNAAFVQKAVSISAGTAYTVKVEWKTNRAARGATIWAAAGPGGGPFSQSRLSVRQLPAGSAFKASTTQPTLTNSDGTTWTSIDAANLTTSFTGVTGQYAILTGNADLFTATAGYNQDIGIQLSGPGIPGSGAVEAWKESGGFAGIYSPNAAFVEAAVPLPGTGSYTATLVWKTNKVEPAGVIVYDGAGGPVTFSPTTIVAQVVAADHVQAVVNPRTAQYTQANSDGANWMEVNAPTYSHLFVEPTGSSTCFAVVSANADLWTTNGGFNQDLGIFINNGTTPVAWKESGGFAGTYSPNAAMVETELTVTASQPITIKWKTNRRSGTTIYAGAGNPSSALGFSPTTLLVQYIGC